MIILPFGLIIASTCRSMSCGSYVDSFSLVVKSGASNYNPNSNTYVAHDYVVSLDVGSSLMPLLLPA